MKSLIVCAVLLYVCLHTEAFVDRKQSSPGGGNKGQHEGSIQVTANRDAGRGPQIRTEAGHIYKNGNFEIGAQATHEAGRGRKPSYGGYVGGTYRWKREAEVEDNDAADQNADFEREKRSIRDRWRPIGRPNPDIFPRPSPTFPRPERPDFLRHVRAVDDVEEVEGTARPTRSLQERWRPDSTFVRPLIDIRPRPSPTIPEHPKPRYLRDVSEVEDAEAVDAVAEDEAEAAIREKRSLSTGHSTGGSRTGGNKGGNKGGSKGGSKGGNNGGIGNGNGSRRLARDVADIDEANDEAQAEIREKRSLSAGRGGSWGGGFGGNRGGNRGGSKGGNNGANKGGNNGGNKGGNKGGIGNGHGSRRVRRDVPDIDEDTARTKRSPKDRGTWDVSVNKDKGRGPQVRTEAQGNIYTSPKGNVRVDAGGHHEFGKGRKPDYGGHVRVTGRFRRDLAEEEAENVLEQREKRSPKEKGTWDVSVNKDKGNGPQVRTEAQGNIYTSPNGNVRVDAGGHHEFGKGRKPDYGGHVRVTGRFKRDLAEEEEEEEQVQEQREKRSPKEKGTWDVSVNKDKGNGPQVRTEAQGNIYTSPNGNVRVDAGGHHEFGKGRKPDYGGHVRVTGRFRRDLAEEEEEEELEGDEGREKRELSRLPIPGGVMGGVNRPIRVINPYLPPYQFPKPIYRGRREAAEVSETDREDLEDVNEVDEMLSDTRRKRSFAPGGSSVPSSSGSGNQQRDRGSWGVSVNKDQGRGPQVRTEGKGNVHTSKDGRVRIDAHGHHEFGKGRKPSYGGGVSGRWKRDVAEAEEETAEDIQEEGDARVRRQANPQNRGSVGVSVDHQHGRGPMVRTDANYNLYRNHNGNWQLNANAFHEAARGMKPNYGGGLTLTGRFRRDTEAEAEDEELEEVRVRREANPQQKVGNGSVSVSVNKDQGRGPQIRTDVERNIYTSRDKTFKVHGSGYHEAGRGRKPDYGGRISITKSF